jgi:hypothetical protein
MDASKWLFLLLHLAMVVISGGTLLFSDNLVVIGVMMTIVAIVFAGCLYFDGCIVSKVEAAIPILDVTPTELVKKSLWLGDSLRLQDIEKLLLGLTLIAFVAKFGVLYFVETTERRPFATVVARLGRTRGLGKQLHSVLV